MSKENLLFNSYAFHRSRLASSLRRRHSQVRGITSGVRLETSITPRKNIMELNFIQPLCGVPLAVSNENLSNSHNNDSSHWVEEGEESNKNLRVIMISKLHWNRISEMKIFFKDPNAKCDAFVVSNSDDKVNTYQIQVMST
ncbi:hypothetical protein HN873_018277 [Arachis hypogaea]